jgi:hypothetical protein
MNALFGPMHKDYCLYFYYLSIFGFILLTLSFLTMVRLVIARKRGGMFYMNSFMVLLGYGIFYFQNRLLHSMCSNSL